MDRIGANLFLETLLDEGVSHIFGNPGTTELPLMDALVNEDRLQFILCLQESIAIGAAEGYSFATGKPGIVNLHVAPGLGNAMGNLYNSKRAGSPLVVTAGNQGQPGHFPEIILYDDLVKIANPLTKWAYEVRRVEDLEAAVRRAIKVALTPPTGPVFLSLPGDVLQSPAQGLIGRPTRIPIRFPADMEAIQQAAHLIHSSKRPFIVSGQGVSRSCAQDDLVHLAEMIGAKVYGECASNAFSFPVIHPLFAGDLPRLARPMREILEKADLLLLIGSEPLVLSFPPEVHAIPENLTTIQLGLNPWDIGKSYPVDAALYGDPKTTLPILIGELEKRWGDNERGLVRERRNRVEKEIKVFWEKTTPAMKAEEEKKKGMSRSAFQLTLREAIPEGSAFVDESLTTGGNALRRSIGAKVPDLFGMKAGGIGMGLPTTLGVKAARPDQPVICVSGDGSAMYTIQTLYSAAKYKLNAVWIIANNKSYRILKERVLNLNRNSQEFRKFVAMDFRDPELDFVRLSEGMGVKAVRAETPNELKNAIQKALAAGEPYLIDALLDLEPLER